MRPLIGTSFKMNLTSSEVRAYIEVLKPLVEPVAGCDLFLLPPFTAIWAAREALGDSRVAWGAQDVHHEPSGAHTGDVSAAMLADLGCTFVEVGHSERRRDHGETDGAIGLKVRAVLDHGMTPILCVGEPTKRARSEAVEHVTRQLHAGLREVDARERSRVVIAYEPVWAIGVGSTAAGPDHVAEMHAAIRDALRGTETRVIYGGSVDQSTAGPLLASGDVEGLFVGRSGLDPTEFAAIARIADGRRAHVP